MLVARACLPGPRHLLCCGAWALLAGQERDRAARPVLASPPRCSPGHSGSVSPLCPRQPQEPSQRQEPRYTNDYLSLGALPGIPQQRGTQGAELLLCSQTSSARCCSVHSPQGNQTLWIFWSFVVKLFPNSNRFKYHRTNGREKHFMQLQGGFLRWLSY